MPKRICIISNGTRRDLTVKIKRSFTIVISCDYFPEQTANRKRYTSENSNLGIFDLQEKH